MKRKIYEKLLEWKRNSASKCALLIEGARRVGKSYVVEQFAKNEYEHYLIIDFASTKPRIKRVFEEYLSNMDEFFMQLELCTGVKLEAGKSLIVFDEVQRYPRAREAIKYLVADGRYHYLETGSLISLRKNIEHIVIPSEERRVKMYPMDFEEFLEAIGHGGTLSLIRNRFSNMTPMGTAEHRMAMELFRQYLVVGGMPQSVAAFAADRNLSNVEEAKRMILDLYEDDIAKFAGRLRHKVKAVWKGIPGALSEKDKKFSPGSIAKGTRMRDLVAPFDWLEESMTVNVASNVTDPNVGFRMTEDRSLLKCYMGDTGLLVSHAFSENPAAREDIVRKIMCGKLEINKGMLMENAVAQMLRTAGQKLFFHYAYDAYDSQKRMEIDFLIVKSKVSNRHNVCPIEVKSAKDYTTTSLEKFKRKFPGYISRSIILYPGDLKAEGNLIHLPLYMAPFIPEIA